MLKVLGIGNALVDVMTSIESDALLAELNLPKGSMQLVNEISMGNAISKTKKLKQILASGGSAANTINGLANLGVETSFIGKVGNDEMGEFFKSDMIKNSINPLLLKGKSSTGMALALISPDSERTFAVNLGAAIEMLPSDLKIEMFEGFHLFHIEGYLVQNHQLIEKALLLAKQAGLKISLDLASFNVVEANIGFLEKAVVNYVDILFANEDEAKAFTGKSPEESLNYLSKIVEIAIVKVGEKGSYIKKGDLIHKVGVTKANCIDTTGAGDLYASGFLYGMLNDVPLDICGEIGAILSGNVIEQIGPKMPEEVWVKLRQMVNDVINGKRFTCV
jgi:sugar/nucleoside kinase (ribokinase family)